MRLSFAFLSTIAIGISVPSAKQQTLLKCSILGGCINLIHKVRVALLPAKTPKKKKNSLGWIYGSKNNKNVSIVKLYQKRLEDDRKKTKSKLFNS
ncbi:hypothetical protein CDQ71_00195 [Campylobacter hyointestinalis subsp. hyointestinalis]|uniref:hypothetical protein n=1 Tax=Campylobacter hyointestinalis TaxID=198 RepID=UPI000CE30D36|nr:hypothetical protein [Campylobacter hyointestinalis]PPB58751.1 hypothetical protein CDQ71_00195 [Campylobacter hyointestinalis subsp. hyointestinalis]TWO19250.1 hypothetical protein YZ80_07680 [Campylobacter hyointestinalis]